MLYYYCIITINVMFFSIDTDVQQKQRLHFMTAVVMVNGAPVNGWKQFFFPYIDLPTYYKQCTLGI